MGIEEANSGFLKNVEKRTEPFERRTEVTPRRADVFHVERGGEAGGGWVTHFS